MEGERRGKREVWGGLRVEAGRGREREGKEQTEDKHKETERGSHMRLSLMAHQGSPVT